MYVHAVYWVHRSCLKAGTSRFPSIPSNRTCTKMIKVMNHWSILIEVLDICREDARYLALDPDCIERNIQCDCKEQGPRYHPIGHCWSLNEQVDLLSNACMSACMHHDLSIDQRFRSNKIHWQPMDGKTRSNTDNCWHWELIIIHHTLLDHIYDFLSSSLA